MMTAAVTLTALEACRHDAMKCMVALDSERAEDNSVAAKQRWRELDDEAARLTGKGRLV